MNEIRLANLKNKVLINGTQDNFRTNLCILRLRRRGTACGGGGLKQSINKEKETEHKITSAQTPASSACGGGGPLAVAAGCREEKIKQKKQNTR